MFELDNSKYNFPKVEFTVDKSLGDHIKNPFSSSSFFGFLLDKLVQVKHQ